MQGLLAEGLLPQKLLVRGRRRSQLMAVSARLQAVSWPPTILAFASQGQCLCHRLLAYTSFWSVRAVEPQLCCPLVFEVTSKYVLGTSHKVECAQLSGLPRRYWGLATRSSRWKSATSVPSMSTSWLSGKPRNLCPRRWAMQQRCWQLGAWCESGSLVKQMFSSVSGLGRVLKKPVSL